MALSFPRRPAALDSTALAFLRSASQKSNQDFELACLNRAAEFRKQLIGLFDLLCEETAAAHLARAIREMRMAETAAEQQEATRPMRDEFVRVRLTKAEARAVGRLVEMSGQPTLAAYVRSLIYQDARARKIRLE